MSFGKRLKELRKKYNLTQEELGEKISKTRSTIAGYETERKEPDYNTLKSIADLFDVSVDYLLGIVDDPNSIKITGEKIPKELREVGVEYLTLAKEMENRKIPPEDVMKIMDIIKKNED